MIKKILTSALITGAVLISASAKEAKLPDIYSQSFSNPKLFEQFRNYYNQAVGINKPKKIDDITWLTENKMVGKTIYLTKKLEGSKKDVDALYNRTLKYFGPRDKVNTSILYLGKYLAYDTTKNFCKVFKNTDFFQNGGKVKVKVIDTFNKTTTQVALSSQKDCQKAAEQTKKYSDILQNMIKKNRK